MNQETICWEKKYAPGVPEKLPSFGEFVFAAYRRRVFVDGVS
jgi:hypothetical protein